MTPRRRVLSAALAYLALALATTWPLVLRAGSAMAGPFGDPLLNTWILAWGADRALHGFRGFWTGLFFYPYPDTVAYSEHLLGITLFTAPIQWLSGNPVLAYNAAVIFACALAGFGTWLLARDLTGRDDTALVAGVAFACAPFRLVHVSHLQMLMAGWMPVSLWALGRYLRAGDRRWLVAWGAAFILNAWSNGYYMYFLTVPTAIVVGQRDRGRTAIGPGAS